MKQLPSVLRLLSNRNFLLMSSIVLGMALGDAARWTSALTVPGLALAMTVSLTQVASSAFRSPRNLGRAALVSVLLSYGVLGGLTLLLARFWSPDAELWTGFVLAAAVPPGIAVIPFSYLLGGDTAFALLGSVGAYLGSLAIMPLMAMALLGSRALQPAKLFPILIQLIIAPLLLSRILQAKALKPHVDRWRATLINWSFALVIFTVIGLNRDLLLSQPQVVLFTAVIGAAGTFGLAYVLERALAQLGMERSLRVTCVLMGTIKNTSLAAATALALFSQRAAVPAAVISAVNVVYLVWLGARDR